MPNIPLKYFIPIDVDTNHSHYSTKSPTTLWRCVSRLHLNRRSAHECTVSDGRIGYLSSGLFAGMMIGAIGWGSCTILSYFFECCFLILLLGSDILGRSTAFNLTLCFTALFGLAASVMPSYPTLCISLFFLGTSVGVRCSWLSLMKLLFSYRS